jgi:GTP-binding protein
LLGAERVIAHNQPGTTRDSIFINFQRHHKNYVLVDTAGVRRRSKIKEKIEKFSIIKTLQTIALVDVVVFLLDATENITEQDLKLLGFILEEGKALVVTVNKWDSLSLLEQKKIKSELKRRLTFLDFVTYHFISALYGQGISKLFSTIEQAYTNTTKSLPTSELNNILEQAVIAHQPPLVKGREVKLRYAHIGHYAPPTIIIHGVRTSFLPDSYRRYLANFFRQSLRLHGTPIKIVFKNTH